MVGLDFEEKGLEKRVRMGEEDIAGYVSTNGDRLLWWA
jgi:hypothetical protein